MQSRDFVYWLQGFFEISEATELNAKQVDMIKRHLAMVFIHEIDPSFPDNQQDALNQVHQPQSGWGSEITSSNPIDYPPGMKC